MSTISDERLAKMLAEVEVEQDNAVADADADQNPQLAIDAVGEFTLSEMRSILSELQSLRAQGGVRVKPLEWQYLKSEYPETYEATGILTGAYRVFVDEDSAAGAILAEWALDPDHFCTTYAKSIGRFCNWEDAKAAAQADYERRILSAIEASPAEGKSDRDMRDGMDCNYPDCGCCFDSKCSDAPDAALAAKGGQ